MPDNDNGNIKCPFFRKAYRRGLTCEGFIKQTTLNITFGVAGEKAAYIEDFCAADGCWQGCPIAQLAEEKYQR